MREDYEDEIIRIEKGIQTVFDPSELPCVSALHKLQIGWIMLLQLKFLCDGNTAI